jgi:hypothetical protein
MKDSHILFFRTTRYAQDVSWSGVRIHVDAEPVIFGETRNAPNVHSAHARSSGARSPVIVARRQEIGAYYSRRSFLF